tara:strand:- start:1509 stop:1676 length:168 start_codon:yes stop_codon:yes gene_type:complete
MVPVQQRCLSGKRDKRSKYSGARMKKRHLNLAKDTKLNREQTPSETQIIITRSMY